MKRIPENKVHEFLKQNNDLFISKLEASCKNALKHLISLPNSLKLLLSTTFYDLVLAMDKERIYLSNNSYLEPDFVFTSINGKIIIVELKTSSTSLRSSITQLLSYMGQLERLYSTVPRGNFVFVLISTEWTNMAKNAVRTLVKTGNILILPLKMNVLTDNNENIKDIQLEIVDDIFDDFIWVPIPTKNFKMLLIGWSDGAIEPTELISRVQLEFEKNGYDVILFALKSRYAIPNAYDIPNGIAIVGIDHQELAFENLTQISTSSTRKEIENILDLLFGKKRKDNEDYIMPFGNSFIEQVEHVLDIIFKFLLASKHRIEREADMGFFKGYSKLITEWDILKISYTGRIRDLVEYILLWGLTLPENDQLTLFLTDDKFQSFLEEIQSFGFFVNCAANFIFSDWYFSKEHQELFMDSLMDYISNNW